MLIVLILLTSYLEFLVHQRCDVHVHLINGRLLDHHLQQQVS